MGDKRADPSAADRSLAAALYERHLGLIYKTALELLDDKGQKEAAAHETLLRLLRNAKTLRGLDERAAAVYVAATARSVALDMRRAAAKERRYLVDAELSTLTELPADTDPETALIEAETRRLRLEALWEALAELSDSDRALLLGKYAVGKSDEELAAQFGVRAGSIPKKLTRAKERARRIILRKEGEHGTHGSER